MKTVKEMIDKAIERYESLKPYVLFCNPSDEKEVKKVVGEKVRVISNPAVSSDMVYLMRKADLDCVGLIKPLVFGTEGEEDEDSD